MYVYVAVDKMTEQSGKPMKTRQSYGFQNCCIPLSFFRIRITTKTNKILFQKPPSVGERKTEWLIKARRDEEPEFKVGNGVDCRKETTSLSVSCPAVIRLFLCRTGGHKTKSSTMLQDLDGTLELLWRM